MKAYDSIMATKIIRRTKPAFRGYTNGDGTRKESAPEGWPFGTVTQRVSSAQPVRINRAAR